MKVFVQVLLLGSALLLAYEGQAQSRPTAPRRAVPKKRAVVSAIMVKDGVMMKDGKPILTEMGMSVPLTTTKTTVNGTVITPSGQVTNRDSTFQLGEGDMVSLTGRLTTRRQMVAQDSVRKLVSYDLKHPGKRKEMDEKRKKAEKAKAKVDAEKAKELAKRQEELAKRQAKTSK